MAEKLKAAEVRKVQHACNVFTNKFLKGVAPLKVDGKKGKATNSHILACKFYLGWGSNRTSSVSAEFLKLLANPHRKAYPAKGMRASGRYRRAKQKARWAQQHAAATVSPGVTKFDGVPVAKVAVPILQWCRQHGWHGRLVSGYRTPAYSESLCYRMCGRPSCPGKCAGRSTNHSGNTPQRFAVDVSDYGSFRSVVARCPVRPRIYNDLPIDPVHFSPNGH
jgi:hypothetical protein